MLFIKRKSRFLPFLFLKFIKKHKKNRFSKDLNSSNFFAGGEVLQGTAAGLSSGFVSG